MDVSSYVDRIVKAKASMGGNVIRDGSYTFAVRKIAIEPSNKGSQVWFKVELYTVESAPVTIDPNLLKPNEIAPVPNSVGSDAVYITDIGAQVGQSNVKGFFLALLNKTENEVDSNLAWLSEQIKKALDPSQPFKGYAIACSTFRKITKTGANANKPFTGYNWKHVPTSAEDIAALRGLLDGAKPAAT